VKRQTNSEIGTREKPYPRDETIFPKEDSTLEGGRKPRSEYSSALSSEKEIDWADSLLKKARDRKADLGVNES